MLQLHSEDPIIYSTRPVQMERVTLKVGEPFPVLRLRGLPLDATPAQIAALFEVSESKVTFGEFHSSMHGPAVGCSPAMLQSRWTRRW